MNPLKKAALALAMGGVLAGTPLYAQSLSSRVTPNTPNNLAAGGVEEAIEALAMGLEELGMAVENLANFVTTTFTQIGEAIADIYATLGDVATALGEAIAAHDAAMDARVQALGQGLGEAIGNHDAAMDARVTAAAQALGQAIGNHDAAMDARVQALAELIVQNQQQVVRLHVERNLGTGPDPTLNRIALFQIPQAQGGLLETVRGVIADTIAKQQAAGISINPFIQTEINAGDLDYALGAFKQAYDHYRTAYLGLASL